MNGWHGEEISTQTFTTIKVEYLQCSGDSRRIGVANTGATSYSHLQKLWPRT